jgi:NaMN:DMB phosphoribosyltransferase
MLDVPFACSSVSFANSSKEAFRLYEDGHVKEGVGAGAALAVATLSLSLTEEQLVSEIDKVYDILVSEDY